MKPPALSNDLNSTEVPQNRLAHRLAWVLACVTFPLICVGGSVTTYRAGMAVPDWPNTFGYNLFLYPLSSWLAVWDVFLEHGHRLLGASAGLVSIALALTLWRSDGRRGVRWLGALALAGVCSQGLLGGLRVTGNALFLAMVHGCTAPLLFVLMTTLVALTSPAWRQPLQPIQPPLPPGAPPTMAPLSPWGREAGGEGADPRKHEAIVGRPPATAALVAASGIYMQIVLGAQLRHPGLGRAPGWFTLWIWLHVILAGLLAVVVVGLLRLTARRCPDQPMLRRRSRWLLGLFALQLVLGAAAWITHYNWPVWFSDWFWKIEYTVVTGGRLQALLTTAHVAVGSLNLAVAASLALWWRRLAQASPKSSFP